MHQQHYQNQYQPQLQHQHNSLPPPPSSHHRHLLSNSVESPLGNCCYDATTTKTDLGSGAASAGFFRAEDDGYIRAGGAGAVAGVYTTQNATLGRDPVYSAPGTGHLSNHLQQYQPSSAARGNCCNTLPNTGAGTTRRPTPMNGSGGGGGADSPSSSAASSTRQYAPILRQQHSATPPLAPTSASSESPPVLPGSVRLNGGVASNCFHQPEVGDHVTTDSTEMNLQTSTAGVVCEIASASRNPTTLV